MPVSSSKLFSRYLPLTLSILLLVFAVAVVLVLRDKNKTADAAWYSSSWTYRKPITIDKNKVSGVATSTHSSFPMLFSVTDTDLKYTSFGGKVASSTGADILFTNSDGTTKLSHEIEKYSSSTGETIIWVKIPTLSATSDTTIYIYFGNSGASDQQDITNVWDSNYKGVWHMGQTATSTSAYILDSTLNANNASSSGTSYPVPTSGGKIGVGQNFDGSNDHFSVVDADSLDITNSLTMSAWINVDAWPSGNFDAIMNKESGDARGVWSFYMTSEQKVRPYLATAAYTDSGAISTSTWAYVTAVYNQSETKVYTYLNGISQGTPGTRSANLSTSTNAFTLGRGTFSSWNGYFDGIMDEARVSATARSADWIKTEYNNQSSPGTFYAYGSVQIERVINFPSLEAPAGPSWYSSSWTYRKPITIDKNKVSGVATSTHSSFPMLFSVTDTDLKYTDFGGKVGKTDGTDILFTSSDGTTKLSHEIEKYSSSTGETIIWVKIPELSAISDTTIYIYFGNSGASDQQDITNVWDSNYKGVWHLKDGNSLDTNDSTNNAFNLTQNGSPTPVTGKIDGGMGLNGSSQYGSRASITHNSGAITVSLWAKRNWTETPSIYRDTFAISSSCASDSGIGLSLSAQANNFDWLAKDILFYGDGYGSASAPRAIAASNLSGNDWHYITGVLGTSAAKIYVDGVELSPRIAMTNTVPSITANLNVGGYLACSGYNDGTIDEVRFSDSIRSTDWVKTEYNNQTSPATFYAYGALGTERSSTNRVKDRGASGLSWYSSSWQYRKPITIDKNKVSGVATSTHYSFPILFSVTDSDLKYTDYSGKVASSTGADILFTSSDGTTKLSHEIEKYSSSTGETIIWVKIPTLSATSDTTIYIYFGNSGASDQQDATNVWDGNYKGVYHLKNGTTLSVNDSTSNALNMTAASLTATSGKVDGAADFDGTSGKMYAAATAVTNVTYSAWIKADAFPSAGTENGAAIVGMYSTIDDDAPEFSATLGLRPDGKLVAYSYDGAIQSLNGATTLSTGSWYYAVFRQENASTLKLYLNGIQDATQAFGSHYTTWGAGPYYVSSYISREYPSNTTDFRSRLNGQVDELRISNTTRSADWIKTEYNNQSSPSTFYSYGAVGTFSRQDSSGGSTPTVKVRGGVKFR